MSEMPVQVKQQQDAPSGGGGRAYESHLKAWMDANGVTAIDLVRHCNVGVNTAYKAARGHESITLDTLVRIYNGLKAAGYPISLAEIVTIL